MPRGDEWRGRGIPDEGIGSGKNILEMIHPQDQIAQAIWSLGAVFNKQALSGDFPMGGLTRPLFALRIFANEDRNPNPRIFQGVSRLML